MHDVMLDLETLSLRPNAAILSIGAVSFDRMVPWSDQQSDEFEVIINLDSYNSIPLHIDPVTVGWWLKQNDQAREPFTRPDGVKLILSIALGHLSAWMPSEPVVWGNASTFDISILRAAYDACLYPCPWHYRNEMCYRTMRRMFPDVQGYPEKSEDKKHRALEDARMQAEHLCNIMMYLKGANVCE